MTQTTTTTEKTCDRGRLTFTTIGPVRGSCGHRHRSWAAAKRCLDHDTRGCAAQRGYSDREIYAQDAEQRTFGEPRLRPHGSPSVHKPVHCSLADQDPGDEWRRAAELEYEEYLDSQTRVLDEDMRKLQSADRV